MAEQRSPARVSDEVGVLGADGVSTTESRSAELVAAAERFEARYIALQRGFAVHGTPTRDTEQLVDSRRNRSHPVHRWYNLKEAYSAELPNWAVGWMRSR